MLTSSLLLLLLRLAAAIDCDDATWGPWRCHGDAARCSTPTAVRYRCLFGDCVESSRCAGQPGHREEMACRHALSKDLCKPWYGPWSQWSSCSATCGLQERSRSRPCRGAFSYASAKDSCQDFAWVRRQTELGRSGSRQAKACPERRSCPRLDGSWGMWGHFSDCSVTCGVGLRIRTRRCNNPKPRHGGFPCSGIDVMQTECIADRECPQNGHWCPWTAIKVCSAACGGGVGIRKRICECPEPKFGGQPCYGPSQLDEACNTHFCPYPKDLSDNEKLILRRHLYSMRQEDMWATSTSEVASTGDYINLECSAQSPPRTLIFDRRGRFPQRRYFWLRNSRRLNDSELLYTADDYLIIRRLSREDLGLYQLVVERHPGLFNTICYFLLYVSDIEVTVQAGRSHRFDCNIHHLDAVVSLDPELWRIEWRFSPDRKARSLGATVTAFWPFTRQYATFRELSVRNLTNVAMTMSGVYECLVYREASNVSVFARFTSTRFRMHVTPPLTYFGELMDWVRVNVWAIVGLFATAGVMVVCSICTIRLWAGWEYRRP